MALLDVRVVGSPEGPSAKYVYELRSSDTEGIGPLEQEYSADPSPALVRDLCANIDEVVEQARGERGAADPLAELARLGGLLYQALFPRAHGSIPDLVTRLGRREGPLLVRSNESLIPWELLHDGEEFLSLKHDLGRRSVVDRPVVGGRTIGTINRALIVGDPGGDLEMAHREAEHVAAWLDQRGANCTVLLGEEATLLEVVGQLASGRFDLLHYCGHVAVPFGTTDVGLVLHHNELLDERALHPLADVGVPPLVFINGCASAARLTNLCVSFMVMGAKAVVGTRFEVGEEGPQRFAELFYADLTAGAPAGAAVREARWELRRASDLDWASFILYGDPAARITPGGPAPPPPPPPRQLQGVEQRLDREARELVRQVVRRAAPRGIVTSMDLLAELLCTRDLRQRLAGMVGPERLALADELLNALFGSVPTSAAESDADGAEVEFSDTVTSVLALAVEDAVAAGRQVATVGDVVAAFVTVGGGTSAHVLDLFGISLADLAERDAAGVEPRPPESSGSTVRTGTVAGAADEGNGGPPPGRLFGPDGRLRTERLDPTVVRAVRAAVLLAAARGMVVSTHALLLGFGIADSAVLRDALREQGAAGEKAMRGLASAADAHSGAVSPRTRRALDRAAAAAGPKLGDADVLREILSEAGSAARSLLTELGVDPDRVLSALPRRS